MLRYVWVCLCLCLYVFECVIVLMTSVFVLFSYVPRNDKDVDEYNDNINAAVDDG